MKKILIVGAGGFGREVLFLIERCNKKKLIYNEILFIDDGHNVGDKVSNHTVIGNIEDLKEWNEHVDVAIAIGSAKVRRKIVESLMKNKNLNFPNLIDPSAMVDGNHIGKGNIICANNIFTVDYKLGDFNIINLACTIGHDVRMENYITVYPGVNISGNVTINCEVEIGTGSKIIQGKTINEKVIIGAGAVVTQDIEMNVTAVGIPAKKIKENGVIQG